MGNRHYIHGTSATEQERLAALNRHSNPSFVRFLPASAGEAVLEVGSGLGLLATEVATARGVSLTGIEYNGAQLAKAQLLDSPVRWMQGDAHALPFEDGAFDGAYCRYVLEHVQDPAAVTREIWRVLKPGGWFATQENNIRIHETWPDCPTFEAVWRQFAMLQHSLGGDALVGKKLHALALQAGFVDIEISIEPEVYAFGQPEYTLWLENLIGVAESGRLAMVDGGFCREGQLDEAMAELQALQGNPGGSVYFYWNRLKARKPVNL